MAIQRLGSDLVKYKSMTLRRHLDGLVNSMSPTQFGAKGDGVTDDTAAFQACIDALSQPANLGKIMQIHPGTYIINDTLRCSRSINIVGGSHAYYDGTTRLICGKPDMTMWHFGYSENQIRNLVISGYERIDQGNSYGQLGTCRGIEFVRDNGSKDIDSWLFDCMIVGFEEGVYAEGANLKHKGGIYTACRNPIVLRYADSAPDDFRGFILDDLRFHSCGSGIEGDDVVCIKTIGTFKNSRISNAFADGGCRKFYMGSLAETSSIDGLTQRYNFMYAPCIEVDNTGITPSSSYQSYRITNINYEAPGGSAQVMGGEFLKLTNAPCGLIANITTAFTGRGFLTASGTDDMVISNVLCRNLHAFNDGTQSDVFYLRSCKNWQVNNVLVRNSLRVDQTRSFFNLDSTCSAIYVDSIGHNNVTTLFMGGGTILGNARNTLNVTTEVGVTSATTAIASPQPETVYRFTGSGTMNLSTMGTNLPVGSRVHISFATGTGILVLKTGGSGIYVSSDKTYNGSSWEGCSLTLVLTDRGWQPTSRP